MQAYIEDMILKTRCRQIGVATPKHYVSALIAGWCWGLIFLAVIVAIALSLIVGCEPARAEEMDLTKAIIHHTASPDVSTEVIDIWHKEKGWDGIGYHYVIRKDGTIEEGRPLSKKGAHAKGRNHYIGIALTGYDMFTTRQEEALKILIKRLPITHIENHHERCPGRGVDLKELAEELNITQEKESWK